MTDYEKQAEDFLKKAGARMHISRIGEEEWPTKCGRMWHYKYQIVIFRGGKTYRCTFFDSYENWKRNKRPTHYSVLASLEKWPVQEELEDFAKEYGYELGSWDDFKRIKKTHEACKREYAGLLDLFGEDLMNELREIN